MRHNDILNETLKELKDEKSNSHDLTVNVEMLGVLMNNLTNLYSDPKVGAFRETLSNAIDSHVNGAKNTTDFVEVVLPHYEKNGSHITIRDAGTGMSRDTIVNNFLSYGSSTKRADNKQAGRFGYGGKSPLAVAEQFHVVSVKDGFWNAFTVTKDLEDTEVPPKFEWDEKCENGPVPTEEKNGVSVSYKIPSSLVRVGYKNEIEDWNPSEFTLLGVPHNSVKVNGVVVSKTVHNSELFEPVQYESETVGWVCTDSDFTLDDKHVEGYLYVHIGNVIYRVENSTISSSTDASRLEGWSTVTVLNAPIGSLDMTPSRDELRYTARTVETLKLVIEQYISASQMKVQAEVNRASTMTEAATIVAKLHDKNFPFSTEAPTAYRNHGNVLKAILDINRKLSESIKNKKPAISEFSISANSRYEKPKPYQNAFGGNRKLSSLFEAISKYPTYVHETVDKPTASRVRRNWDLLSSFSSQSSQHTAHPDTKNLVIVDSLFVTQNDWTEGIFGRTEKLTPSIEAARKKRNAYNKEHGITSIRQPRTNREQARKVAFVTVSTDPTDSAKYVLTPYDNVEDGANLGKHYKHIVSDGESPNFSASKYSESVESGAYENVKDELKLKILHAESKGYKVVLRTSRQAPVSFPDEVDISRDALKSWSASQTAAPPVMNEKEVRTRLLIGNRLKDIDSHSAQQLSINTGLSRYVQGSSYSISSFSASLHKFNDFLEENNLEAPATLEEYLTSVREAKDTILNSEISEWIKYRNKDIHARSTYAYYYLQETAYAEQYKPIVSKIEKEIQELKTLCSILFLAVSLHDDEVSETQKKLLERQIKAILSVIE